MRNTSRILSLTLIGLAVATAGGATGPQSAGHRGGPGHSIERQLRAISAKLDDLFVPFKVQIAGGVCDSAAAPSSNPHIVVDGDGEGHFVITSILIKRAPQNPVDFLFLAVNEVEINGTRFATRTGNLFDPLFGEFAVEQSADIMGMPVRKGGNIMTPEPGGNVPHQIVAEAETADDVRVRLFCRSDNQDLGLEAIVVAGWKKKRATITVTYVPDN
jgi:hypothetical protein